MIFEVQSEAEMKAFGRKLGGLLCGGEVVELVGDVGAGKTTLVKGIGEGLGIDEDMQSPSFTISRVYEARDGLRAAHYDFYRLAEPGIMKDELSETIHDPQAITLIEWAQVVKGILPADFLMIHISPIHETARRLTLTAGGTTSRRLLEQLA